MKKGDYVETPRFCAVKIEKVFKNHTTAYKQGYCEPTHYKNWEYEILGKHTGTNTMVFAGVKK